MHASHLLPNLSAFRIIDGVFAHRQLILDYFDRADDALTVALGMGSSSKTTASLSVYLGYGPQGERLSRGATRLRHHPYLLPDRPSAHNQGGGNIISRGAAAQSHIPREFRSQQIQQFQYCSFPASRECPQDGPPE